MAPGLHGVKGPLRASASLRVLARATPVPLTPLRPGAPGCAGTNTPGVGARPPAHQSVEGDMGDKVEQLQADIEKGVAELVEGEDWQRWLRVAARFPRYRTGAAGVFKLLE